MKRLIVLGIALIAMIAATGCKEIPEEPHARGKALYASCIPCHMENGQGNQKIHAPAIAGMEQWYLQTQLMKYKKGWRGMHPDDLEGRKMRPMSLTLPTDRDVEAVALHISSLPQNKPAPTQVAQTGDSTRGQAYFAVCTTCHGTDGAGNQALSAPSLTHLNDWYVLNSLKKFKHKIRGSDPRDAVAAQMIGMAGVLPNEQAMKDVIAYIGTLSNK